MELRDYQKAIVAKGREILSKFGILFLAMEVRTGKTLTALFICQGLNRVLFVTKKKAISSIEEDFERSGLDYYLKVINFESLSKVPMDKWDVVIIDESHSIGSFPKPSKRAKDIKAVVEASLCPTIHLSGTPTPESWSQIYHQLWVNPNSPFADCKSFYSWVKRGYVDKKEKRVNYGRIIADYSNGRKDLIMPKIQPFSIHYSQDQAGFDSKIEEEILYVKMKPSTYSICERLKRDLFIDERVVADTPTKLQQKLHQMYSGTIKFTDGTRKVFDTTKAEFIKTRFEGKRIAIFYKFTAELLALKQVFGDRITDDIATFDSDPHKVIALQIQSGREGTKLSSADALIFYNIDFSATSYWQGRDRMTTKDRKDNRVYWIFAEGGLEDFVYQRVANKKQYTSYYFKKDVVFNTEKMKELSVEKSKEIINLRRI